MLFFTQARLCDVNPIFAVNSLEHSHVQTVDLFIFYRHLFNSLLPYRPLIPKSRGFIGRLTAIAIPKADLRRIRGLFPSPKSELGAFGRFFDLFPEDFWAGQNLILYRVYFLWFGFWPDFLSGLFGLSKDRKAINSGNPPNDKK